MSRIVSQILLLILTLAGGNSWAYEFQFLPDFLAPDNTAIEQQPAPLASQVNYFEDFRTRMTSAIKSGFIEIKSLYYSESVTDDEWTNALLSWHKTLTERPETRINLYGKELDKLPLKAREFWTTQGRRMTDGRATSFALLSLEGNDQFVLPLVYSKERLWILPSK